MFVTKSPQKTTVNIPYLQGIWRIISTQPLPIMVAGLLLRIYHIGTPNEAVVLDENYYVNAARIIDHIPAQQVFINFPYGLDPNWEHPPLGKLIIALGIRLFGDDPYGWRLPAVILGTLSIGIVYYTVLSLRGSKSIALFASFLFAFDPLSIITSRIGTLDVFLLFFTVCAMYLHLNRWKLCTALALTFATLSKVSGSYGLLALIMYDLSIFYLSYRRNKRWDMLLLRPIVIETILYIVSLVWILAILDSLFSRFSNPIFHMFHILHFGLILSSTKLIAGSSYAWEWIIGRGQMGYYRDANVTLYASINPVLVGLGCLGISYALYQLVNQYKGNIAINKLSLFGLCWFFGIYIPFLWLSFVSHRISYIYYIEPGIPGLCILAANLEPILTHNKMVRVNLSLLYILATYSLYAWL